MAEIITMPRLSDTMEEGTVAKWLKKVGDTIEEGDILAEIETDKATMEFESFHEGTLLHIGIEEGDGAPVDSLLAIIGEEGEDISGLLNGSGDGANETEVEVVVQAEVPVSEEKVQETQPKAEVDTAVASEATAVDAVPEGVEIISMPRLSDTMEEGTVASWLKKVGDTVEEGDILAEIETDKATMEFESFYSGTLLYIGIQEGEGAPVDSLLAIIGPEGTDVDALLNGTGNAAQAVEAEPKTEEKTAMPEPTVAVQETTADVPVASPVKPVEEAVKATDGRVIASPLAKKIAADKGIDLNVLQGSGDNGRIIKRDVENYKGSAAPMAKAAVPLEMAQDKAAGETVSKAAAAPVPAPIIGGEEGFEEVKNSSMRKAITKHLSASKFTAPHFYLTIEVDMDNAKNSRAQINSLPDTKVSFNDMVLKACAMALKKHPQVNTTWSDEATVYKKHIHMGVAVAVDEGLVVPVVKFADQLSLTQIGASVKDLAGRARSRKIRPDELEGSTFTVSNLGMFGIQEFTSIINKPNSAILSVGAIVEKPVVKNGAIVIGNTMKVTLACDHRTVDGAVGAQFLQTLRAYLENPVTMLA